MAREEDTVGEERNSVLGLITCHCNGRSLSDQVPRRDINSAGDDDLLSRVKIMAKGYEDVSVLNLCSLGSRSMSARGSRLVSLAT